jgi:hypothetical protein
MPVHWPTHTSSTPVVLHTQPHLQSYAQRMAHAVQAAKAFLAQTQPKE